jgi:hypothetical protein
MATREITFSLAKNPAQVTGNNPPGTTDTVLWLDAADATDSGGTVTSWTSKEGFNHSFTVNGNPQKLNNIIKGTLPVIQFDGDDWFKCITHDINGQTEVSIFVVWKKITDTVFTNTLTPISYPLESSDNDGNGTTILANQFFSSIVAASAQDGLGAVIGSGTLKTPIGTSAIGDVIITNVTFDIFGNTAKFYVNDTLYASGSSFQAPQPFSLQPHVLLGLPNSRPNFVSTYSGMFFQEQLAEIIVYDSTEEANRQAAMSYLVDKYLNVGQDPLGTGTGRLWLRSDDGVTKNISNNVNQWDDKSGYGNNVSSTGTDRPVWVDDVVNGYPALRFSAAGTYMQRLRASNRPSLSTGSSEMTIAGVYRSTLVEDSTFPLVNLMQNFQTDRQFILKTYAELGATRGIIEFNEESNSAFSWSNEFSSTPVNFVAIIGTADLNIIDFNEMRAYAQTLDGVEPLATYDPAYLTFANSGVHHPYNSVDIGAGLSIASDIDIVELVVFNKKLSSTEINDLIDYFYIRYGTAPLTAPVINSFIIDNPVITEGDDVLLTWTTSNATSASIDQGIGAVAVNDSLIISNVTSNTTWTLTASGPGGPNDVAQVSVIVNPTLPGNGPGGVDNAVAWYDGTFGVTENTGRIEGWTDKSGTGNDLGLPTDLDSRPYPGTLNGVDVVDFVHDVVGGEVGNYLRKTDPTFEGSTFPSGISMIFMGVLQHGHLRTFAQELNGPVYTPRMKFGNIVNFGSTKYISTLFNNLAGTQSTVYTKEVVGSHDEFGGEIVLLAAVYDGAANPTSSNCKFYIGFLSESAIESLGTASAGVRVFGWFDQLVIGQWNATQSRAKFGDFAIFNKQLTPAELNNIFTYFKGKYSEVLTPTISAEVGPGGVLGCVAWWDAASVSAGSVSIWTDSTSLGNDLIQTNPTYQPVAIEDYWGGPTTPNIVDFQTSTKQHMEMTSGFNPGNIPSNGEFTFMMIYEEHAGYGELGEILHAGQTGGELIIHNGGTISPDNLTIIARTTPGPDDSRSFRRDISLGSNPTLSDIFMGDTGEYEGNMLIVKYKSGRLIEIKVAEGPNASSFLYVNDLQDGDQFEFGALYDPEPLAAFDGTLRIRGEFGPPAFAEINPLKVSEMVLFDHATTPAEDAILLSYFTTKYDPVPFDPESLGGLELWLDAQDGATITGAPSVISWTDKSSNGHVFISGTATPSVVSGLGITGHDAIRFDGINDQLVLPAGYNPANTEYTFFVVSSVGSASQLSTILDHRGGSLNQNWSLHQGASSPTGGTPPLSPGDTYSFGSSMGDLDPFEYLSETFPGSAGNVPGTFTIKIGYFRAGVAPDGKGFEAQSIDAGLGDFVDSVPSIFKIGSNLLDAEYWSGDVAEILIYNNWLTPSSRAEVVAFLQDKYGPIT